MADHSTSDNNEEQKVIDGESDKEEPYDFYNSFCSKQRFSLPDSIMYYILKNPPTPKVYQKLAQTCKYFFIKNPVIAISEFYLSYHYIFNNWVISNENGPMKNADLRGKKIWIINSLKLIHSIQGTMNPQYIAKIVPKIYKSDIKQLKFWDQNIFFNDLVFLASKCVNIYLSKSAVINATDDSFVTLQNIVKVLPAVKDFYYDLIKPKPNVITSKTVKELLQIPHFLNLNTFTLKNIPQTFDIELFYGYIKRNKITNINVEFDNRISDAYETRLQKIVNEIVAAENHDYKPPYIFFRGITTPSWLKLSKLCDKI